MLTLTEEKEWIHLNQKAYKRMSKCLSLLKTTNQLFHLLILTKKKKFLKKILKETEIQKEKLLFLLKTSQLTYMLNHYKRIIQFSKMSMKELMKLSSKDWRNLEKWWKKFLLKLVLLVIYHLAMFKKCMEFLKTCLKKKKDLKLI